MPRYSVEQARSAIEATPPEMKRLKAYWNAIIDGKLPEYYLEEFARRKDNYSDEIPSTDVRILIDSQAPMQKHMTKYKCQTTYILGLNLTLQGAVEDDIISDSALKQDIADFIKSDLDFKTGDPKNIDRITRINSVLNKAIAHIAPLITP